MMRTSLFTLTALVIALVAYVFGFYVGKSEMDRFAGNLVNGISASIRADALQVIGAALDDLRAARIGEADGRLRLFARLQAEAISECVRDPACLKLTRKPLPTQAELS